ncbi:hypothetical protein [Streptomyces sp. NPDC090021]
MNRKRVARIMRQAGIRCHPPQAALADLPGQEGPAGPGPDWP